MDNLQRVLDEVTRFKNKRSSLSKNLKTIGERYEVLYTSSANKHKSYLENVEKERLNAIALVETKAKNDIQGFSSMKNSLQEFVRPVRKWCSQEDLRSYVPNPQNVNEQELAQLIKMIQEQGIVAWIKRTFKLGGYTSRAEMALELYKKVEDSCAYCNDKINSIEDTANRNKNNITLEARIKAEAENKRYTSETDELHFSERGEKDHTRGALVDFDTSSELEALHNEIRKKKEEAENSNGNWGEYSSPSSMPKSLYFCDAKVCIPNKNGIDEDMLLPTWINLFESNIIVITSSGGAQADADCKEKLFVRKLLARMLKSIPPEDCSYSVFDSLHKGASLERLIDVSNVGTTDFSFDLYTSDNSNSKNVSCSERRDYLKSRPAEIIKFTAGRSKSLFEYNREEGEFEFPFTWYVDFNFPDKPEDKLKNDLKEMFVNSAAAGYSYIFVTTNSGFQAIAGLAKEYTNTPVIHVDTDQSVCTKDGLSFEYSMNCSPASEQIFNFMTALKQYYADGDRIDNRIDSVFALQGIERRDASEKLTIPMALDSRGKLVDLELGGEGSVHGFISGGTNSGKSTLLHTIILSACLHYHPLDLEIWLVDYKQTEFYLYKKKSPPHIKLIGVSKTEDFTFSLLDKIEAEASKRTDLMNLFEAQNLSEYRKHQGKPGYVNIPRLFIVIDEFHEMSQFVSNEMEYKDRLENILREYRAQGITCLMADQTFSVGLSGLSTAAKNQIGLRIAMRNEASPQEIRDTLEVDRALYSDSMQKTISLMSQGEFIMKVYVRNARGDLTDIKLEKFKALYAKGEDIEPIGRMLRNEFKGQYEKSLIYINTKEQVQWDDAEPKAFDELVPLRDWNMRLYLGRSATLQPCFGVDLGRQPNENMAVVGGETYQRYELLVAVLRSCCFKNYPVYVFLAEYCYLDEYNKEIRTLCDDIPTANLIFTYEDWCRKLSDLDQIIDKRSNSEDILCVFIGLETACIEFERMEDREETLNQVSAMQDMAMKYGVPDSITDFEQNHKQEETPVFDARPIIRKMFLSGTRNGIRCVAEVSAYSEYSKIREIKDMCRHKVAFNMSADDCMYYLGSSNYQKNIGKKAIYSDGGKQIKKLLTYKLS